MCTSQGVPVNASTDGRSKKFAIAIAQCQRTKCVRRSNNPSKVINIRCLRDKDGPTIGKTIKNSTSLQDGFISIGEELRTQATSTSLDAVGNSVRARSRVFLQCKEFIKFSLINSPTDVIRSVLNISQKYLHVGDVSGLLRVPGKWFPSIHKIFFQIHLHSPRCGPLHL